MMTVLGVHSVTVPAASSGAAVVVVVVSRPTAWPCTVGVHSRASAAAPGISSLFMISLSFGFVVLLFPAKAGSMKVIASGAPHGWASARAEKGRARSHIPDRHTVLRLATAHRAGTMPAAKPPHKMKFPYAI